METDAARTRRKKPTRGTLRAVRAFDPASERGGAMLEFALVSLVLFTLILGLIEGGLLVRANNAVASSVDDAVRRGSVAADDPLADWMVLQQIRLRGGVDASRIDRVVVYRAVDGAAVPPETCRQGTPVAGVCNVYDRTAFELPSTAFGCADPLVDGSWCPSDRVHETDTIWLGVWVDASHRGITGVFGNVSLLADARLPLEGTGW